MNTIIKVNVNLSEIPSYDESEVITTTAEGNPLSFIYDKKWDFSGMETRALGKTSLVSFEAIDELFRKDVQSCLAYLFKSFHRRHKIPPSKSQINSWKKGLSQITEILGTCDWASLSDDHKYKVFKTNLVKYYKDKNYTESTLQFLLSTLNKLSEYNLCSRIFSLNELKSNSLILKKAVQSIAIPIGMYQPIIANAINVVETYHPYRAEINQLMLQAYDIRQEELSNTNRSSKNEAVLFRVKTRCKKLQHGIPKFQIKLDGSELSRILSHCAIVILAFSGVRISEMLSFSKESYKEKLVNTGINKRVPILEGKTSKGNDGLPKTETWQTHPIAKDALELAYDMTQHLRDIYKNRIKRQLDEGELTLGNYQCALKEINSAFITADPSRGYRTYTFGSLSDKFNNLITKSSITATQDDVDEFNRLNPTRIGQLKVGARLPKLSPHDFRRTFAVFFKRYGFGTASSIKFQYKHRNINMSEYYANNARLQAMADILLDNELLKLMNEEGIRMGVDIFDEIYNESKHLSGGGGEHIAQNKFQKLKNGHKIYMNRAEIDSLVRNGTLSVVKLPTGGYCLNATCSRVCGIGQFALEIKPCEHLVITDKEAKSILRQNKRLINSFREMNTGDHMMQSILVAMKQKIKRNEVTIEKHHLNYEKFDDLVKGIIVTKET